jgi:D-beta-D-heptose 7-phosphate kinase/D-beta-D-heptose 1-phosphate adenosyltransferase
MTNLWDRKALLSWREELRKTGLSLVFTNGCFDLLHVGHVKQIREAAQFGDRLVVALNSDESVTRLKGETRPLVPLEQRAEVMDAIRWVDYVTAFSEDTPYALISMLVPDVIVKGGDYTPDEVVGKDVVEANGGRVVIFPTVPGSSTTALIERIKRHG